MSASAKKAEEKPADRGLREQRPDLAAANKEVCKALGCASHVRLTARLSVADWRFESREEGKAPDRAAAPPAAGPSVSDRWRALIRPLT